MTRTTTTRLPGLLLAACLCAGYVRGHADEGWPCSAEAVEDDLTGGDYVAAEACARQLAEEAASLPQADQPHVLDVLVEALLANGRGWTVAAHDAARRAVESKRAALDPDDPEVTRSLANLGRVALERGELQAALVTLDEVVTRRRVTPGDPARLAASLADAAVARLRLGRHAEALALSREAVETSALDGGLRHARALEVRAEALVATGSYAEAHADLDGAVSIRGALAPDHPETAQAYCRLGDLLTHEARLSDARDAYRRAVEMFEAGLGRSHPRLVRPLGRAAATEWRAGDLAAGIRLHERAVQMAIEQLGPQHPETGARLNDSANARLASHDYAGARELYERALTLTALEPEPQRSASAATIHYNLSEVAAATGELDLALASAHEALRLWRQGVGPEHAFVAVGLEGVADVLEMRGGTDEALEWLDQALRLRRRVLGDPHPATGATAARLGLGLLARGDTARARAAARVAATSLDRARVTAPASAARTLMLQARLQLPDPRGSRAAVEKALEADALEREYLRRTIRYLGESDALRVVPPRWEGLDVAAAVIGSGASPVTVPRVYDHVVRSRALVLDEIAAREHGSATSGRPEIVLLRARLQRAARRLATLLYRGAPGAPEVQAKTLDAARGERDQAERELALASAEFEQELGRERAGLNEVARALPAGSALVSFLRYEPPPGGGRAGGERGRARAPAPAYLAFVMKAGSSDPCVVPLGRAGAIDAAVSRWREEAGDARAARAAPNAAQRRYREAAMELSRLVWTPLASRLARLERLFIVPDGSLHVVNFSTLPDGDRYLVESPLQIHYLAAERDLVAARDPSATAGGLLAVGAPQYDLPLRDVARTAGSRLVRGPRLADAHVDPGLPFPAGTHEAFRGRRSSCDEARQLHFVELPESGREASEIVRTWRRLVDGDATRLIDAEASVELVSALAPGHRVLHLATHGFFLDEDCEPPVNRAETPAASARRANRENPLLRSGLAFAGANRRNQAGAGDEDGILTSDEVARWDLGSVEWVVLSACSTGRGPIHAGEGVLGLRRAFQKAGARTVIMSLWSVFDDDARAWMQGLYEARLRDGSDTMASMQRASLSRLHALRRRGASTHPALWGGFVAVGDWR